AGLPAVDAGRLQPLFVLRARGRQRQEGRASEDPAVFAEVHEVRRVAILVVDTAGALGAVGLAGQLADLDDRVAGTQEGGDLRRQGAHGGLAEHAVAGVAPGEGGARRGGDGGGQGEGDDARHGAICRAYTLDGKRALAPQQKLHRTTGAISRASSTRTTQAFTWG